MTRTTLIVATIVSSLFSSAAAIAQMAQRLRPGRSRH